ncbi:MAG: response regulator, partial [Magnetococcales bacterium]|nr:response regulator [Magnetococcales bacterium]
MTEFRPRATLVYRLTIYVGLGMLSFALLVGLGTYRYFYARGLAEASDLEQQLVHTVMHQAAVGAFANNETIAQEVVQGLLINSLVLWARIQANDGFQFEQGKKTGLNPETEPNPAPATYYPLPSPVNTREFIGTLGVLLDLAAIQKNATREAMIYAGVMVLQILVSVFILMSLFHRLLGKPVVFLARQMLEIKPGKGSRIPIQTNHVQDEIGLLSGSANALLDAAELAIDEERSLRQQLGSVNSVLQKTQHTLSTLLDNFPGMIYTCRNDANWTMKYVSEGCQTLTGYMSNELQDNRLVSYNMLILEEDQDIVWNQVQEAVSRQTPFILEYRIRDRNGEIKHVWEMGRGVFEADRLQALEGFITDISKRKNMEDALRQAKESAEIATRAKSDFLSTMSHEIRTPLNGLLGMAQLLGRTRLSKRQKSYVDTMMRAGEHLFTTVNDVLDISRIESGKLTLEPMDFLLEPFFDNILDLFTPLAESKGISLACHRDAGLPTALLGDPFRLRQILYNLVSNAIKFTEQGEVVLDILQEESPTPGECRLCVLVRDTGIGIDASRQAQIFTPFVQEETSTSRRYGGSGLGLALSRQLAEIMGGTLTLSSRKGKGSTFILRVGLRIGKKPESIGQQTSLPPLSILVVEDEPINRQVIQHMLEGDGHRVTVVQNGFRALEEMQRGEQYHGILMDLRMPGMDGVEAMQRIHKLPGSAAAVPTIILTADVTQEAYHRSLQAGAFQVLSKPIRLPVLRQALAALPTLPDPNQNSAALTAFPTVASDAAALTALSTAASNAAALTASPTVASDAAPCQPPVSPSATGSSDDLL